jgi:hypothetical protein
VKPSFIVQQQTQLFLFKYNKPDDVNILSQKFLTIKVEQFSLSKLPVNFKEAASTKKIVHSKFWKRYLKTKQKQGVIFKKAS